MDGQREQVFDQVLNGLTYPAEKWQIVTTAEIYGADVATTASLHELPMREYANIEEIAAELPDGSRPAQQA
jgi:hypothetical protein